MDGKSQTPINDKLESLKQVLPEAFTEGKVDWEKLKAALGEDINFSNERYVLNWAGKSDAFKILQAPTTKTLIPAKEESVDFDNTEHVFIEGENLEVLKVLQKSYFGKVKMIYIDPPYNTGNDSFIYPDKFSETIAEYEQRVGDKDEDGYLTKDGLFRKNSKENGQYHSNWLNMMMPRLYLAKNLLRPDGVIFISIDDNEVHNLRLLMNEIFGEENFVANIVWQKKYSPQNDAKWFSNMHDHIICYAKNKFNWYPNLLERTLEQNYRYSNPDNDIRGDWKSSDFSVKTYSAAYDYPITTPSGRVVNPPPSRCWRTSKENFEKLVADNRIWFGVSGTNVPSVKKFLSEVKQGITPSTIWFRDDVGDNQDAAKDIRKLFSVPPFDTPKPVKLLNRILKLGLSSNDLVLDFFSGSGSTAHAVMALNSEDGGTRKCISVQLPELCDEKSEAFKAGYKTIADIAKERIRRAGNKIQQENPDYQGDLGFKVLKLADSNFKQWQQVEGNDLAHIKNQMEMFIDPVEVHATVENMAYELMLKSGFDLNSTLEAKGGFYTVNHTELVLLLEAATQAIIDVVIALNPDKVIALDKLFEGNDQLKTNTALQMKDAAITFKTL